MTQAFNLSQFANKVNTSGQADLTTAVTGTLPVTNGGTGVATLTTAYGVIAAGTTATGALQNIGTGTTNQVLTSNGPGVLPSFKTASGGGTFQTVTYAAPGTWTPPASATSARITVIGGGSGGGGKNGPGAPAGGGQGGGVASVLATGLSGSYPITVGAGGAGGNGNGPQGGAQGGAAGGTSSFGSIASATGGNAGSAGTVSSGTALASGSGLGGDSPGGKLAIAGTIGTLGVGNPANVSGQAAKTWTVSSGYIAGASGQTAINGNDFNGVGGYSGAVIIEYVG
jgi:hypothetical protein